MWLSFSGVCAWIYGANFADLWSARIFTVLIWCCLGFASVTFGLLLRNVGGDLKKMGIWLLCGCLEVFFFQVPSMKRCRFIAICTISVHFLSNQAGVMFSLSDFSSIDNWLFLGWDILSSPIIILLFSKSLGCGILLSISRKPNKVLSFSPLGVSFLMMITCWGVLEGFPFPLFFFRSPGYFFCS